MEKAFEIGDVVEWKISNLNCHGVVRDNDLSKDEVEVLCRSIGYRDCKTLVNVKRELLSKYNG